ncbi:hypothetical protein D3C71_2116440 [compost metagenome]
MKAILIRLRKEMLPLNERLAIEFRLVGDQRINSPEVVSQNKHAIIINLQNSKADESHYLTLAFVSDEVKAE